MHEFWKRVAFAFRCFFSILLHGNVPEDIIRELGRSAIQARTPEAGKKELRTVEENAPDRAVQMLALLQRDGRLIDFLFEDVAPYPDAQLGAAVRTVHESCRKVLEQYFKLEPVISSEEDQPITVQESFDPASIKLIGNLRGEPPVRGVLRHRGWRVVEANMPSLPQGSGRMVVAPAEVEIP